MVILHYFPNDTNVSEHKTVGYWTARDPQGKVGLWFFKHISIAKILMKSYYDLFSKPADPKKDQKLKEGWKKSFEYLNKIKELCDKKKILFVIAAIPSKEQFSFGKKEFYQNKLKVFCDKKNILFLDPYDHFEERGPSNIYLDWDPHFTKEGHRLYGDFIYSKIKPYLKKGDKK